MWTWFLLGIVFLGIEAISFGLISIWFAIDYQFFIFIGVSGISLLLIRKTALVFLKGRGEELDRITKSKIKVENIEQRGNVEIYLVRLDGKIWEAICDEKLIIGEIAQVEKIQGNKLILNKLNN